MPVMLRRWLYQSPQIPYSSASAAYLTPRRLDYGDARDLVTALAEVCDVARERVRIRVMSVTADPMGPFPIDELLTLDDLAKSNRGQRAALTFEVPAESAAEQVGVTAFMTLNEDEPIILAASVHDPDSGVQQGFVLAELTRRVERLGEPIVQPRRYLELALVVLDVLMLALAVGAVLTTPPGLSRWSVLMVVVVAWTVYSIHRHLLARLSALPSMRDRWVEWEPADRADIDNRRYEKKKDRRAFLLGGLVVGGLVTLLGATATALWRLFIP